MTNDASIPQTRATPIDPDLHKRYWLFTWHEGEPRGGISDFDSAFDTPESAKEFYISKPKHYNFAYEIFDSQTGETVNV